MRRTSACERITVWEEFLLCLGHAFAVRLKHRIRIYSQFRSSRRCGRGCKGCTLSFHVTVGDIDRRCSKGEPPYDSALRSLSRTQGLHSKLLKPGLVYMNGELLTTGAPFLTSRLSAMDKSIALSSLPLFISSYSSTAALVKLTEENCINSNEPRSMGPSTIGQCLWTTLLLHVYWFI